MLVRRFPSYATLIATPALIAALAIAAPASAATASAAPVKLGKRTLRVGMRGPDVKLLQRELTAAGLPTPADGAFGSGTAHNVARFKRQQGLRPADGMFRMQDALPLNEVVDAATAGGAHASIAPTGPAHGPAAPAPAPLAPGDHAQLAANGQAIAPASAPPAVKAMIAAGNRIASLPYRYGGGHNDNFLDDAYDCSGSVSFALHGAMMLSSPLDSTGLESFGRPGRGHWVSIYANEGHTFMYVAGLRFDTSGAEAAGSRWQRAHRSSEGYVVRHPDGL